MDQLTTTGIVLARTNYGEADRILTVLTPDYGKLRLMAKGSRRIKSKLAGGIELFSVSNVTFIRGRGDIGTLVSTRLLRHYGRIVSDINRVQLGYDLLKILNKAVEDNAEPAYFNLLQQAFEALDDLSVSNELVRAWFAAQLLRLGGRMPNLQTDSFGAKLDENAAYEFDYDNMVFTQRDGGTFAADDIKFLRLVFSGYQPKVLAAVKNGGSLLPRIALLVQSLYQQVS